MPRFQAEALRQLAAALFVAVGVPPADARLVADHLVEAGLTGHDTHSVLRLPQYVAMVRNGLVHPGAPFEVLSTHQHAVQTRGNWNFGPVTATAAVQLAIERAREGALAVVTVRECNHVARLGGFAASAAAAGMVAIIAANGHGGDLAVTPPGGAGRRLSTNPLSVAIPTNRDWPIVLDMTTSAVSGGYLRLRRNLGAPAPPHTIVDAVGRATTDVERYYGPPPGALLPLGAPTAAHKGFGLGLMVDILAGALSGAGCSGSQGGRSGNALFIAVLRVEAFSRMDQFIGRVDDLIEWIHSCPPAAGLERISLPGEHGHAERCARLQHGIPVDAAAWEQIAALAAQHGVDLPAAMAD